MYFKQIAVEGMGCLSYLIGCPVAKVACVVDPKRDVQDYIELARKNDMTITHVFETHVHADHVSGNRELKSRTGAKTHFCEGSPVAFDHVAVREGDIFEFGNAKLEILKTPGHTPHAMSILVTDRSRGEEPWLVLTGDCLFVGDVGRPDLAGEELIGEQVDNLYRSLYGKLGRLPESVEVFPAHGEGSLCGKGMSAKSSSTIGFEKRNNPVLDMEESAFKSIFSASFPERPKSFTHIIETNKEGAPLLERCPVSRDLSPDQVRARLDAGATVLDARDTAAFGGVHIPGSINIGLAKQTANWIGMVIDPTAELILVVADETAYNAMCTHLHRIGYDNISGYLYGGIAAWQEAGYPIRHLWQISAETLKEKMGGNHRLLIDVRTPAEWQAGHVEGAKHVPLTALLNAPPDFPKNEEIIAMCGIGYRGNIAASYLEGLGYSHIHSLAGGMKAWLSAGYNVIR
ncbi:MAG: rhodanese-like domain-containing protein [Desulfobacterales bacterium]|jgi:glyoxylase-like metal-dependent hydrolase (beta-lactamase superfamily II)/rhodanese-related sulfurtransferase